MNPATINSSPAGTLLTFTLKETTGNNVPGTVAMNAANTMATFTPPAAFVVVRRVYASAKIVPIMYATVQTLLRWRVILGTVKFCAKAIVQNVSVRTDERSVDYINGFFDQIKRRSK